MNLTPQQHLLYSTVRRQGSCGCSLPFLAGHLGVGLPTTSIMLHRVNATLHERGEIIRSVSQRLILMTLGDAEVERETEGVDDDDIEEAA